MMRQCLLLTFCLVLVLSGCADEQTEEPANEQRQMRTLRSQRDSLQWQLRRRSERLHDSLRELHSANDRLKRKVERLKKLRSLLMDNRVGLWGPGEEAAYIHLLDSVDVRTVPGLVDAFNEQFAGSFNPPVQLQSVEGAVAHVTVPDDDQLTERMGTTGSGMYIATMTYTLTSLGRIDSVYLDIDPGSHAGPGYHSREDYVQMVREK